MLQAIVYCFCLILFVYVSEISQGDSYIASYMISNILTLIPFLVLKTVFNKVAQKVCLWTNTMPFRIIFINNNAILQRMILCWALATQFNLISILFVYSIDFLTVLSFAYFVCGPLDVHLRGQ